MTKRLYVHFVDAIAPPNLIAKLCDMGHYYLVFCYASPPRYIKVTQDSHTHVVYVSEFNLLGCSKFPTRYDRIWQPLSQWEMKSGLNLRFWAPARCSFPLKLVWSSEHSSKDFSCRPWNYKYIPVEASDTESQAESQLTQLKTTHSTCRSKLMSLVDLIFHTPKH